MSDQYKVTRYSELYWDDDPPNNDDVNINTLKQLGQSLQNKQDLDYNNIDGQEYHISTNKGQHNKQQQIDHKNKYGYFPKTQIDISRKNKDIDNHMSEYIYSHILGTPNDRFFKLQIVKKDDESFFKQQQSQTFRQYDVKQKRFNGQLSSRDSLMNSKHQLIDKLKDNQHIESQDNCSLIDDEKKYEDSNLFQQQMDKNNVNDKINNITKEQTTQSVDRIKKWKYEEQKEKDATAELKKDVIQVLNQKNQEFIKHFNQMKNNKSKQKQTGLYTKILEICHLKQKIDQNEIQYQKESLINKHRHSQETHLSDLQNNKKSSNKNDISQYQIQNNALNQTRVSKSAQSQRHNFEQDKLIPPQEQQQEQQQKEESQKTYRRSISQFTQYTQGYSNSEGFINSMNELNQTQFQKYSQSQSQQWDQQSFNNDKVKIGYDQLMNHRINRRILSTLRIHKDLSQKSQNIKQNQLIGQNNKDNSNNLQDSQTQTNFNKKIRSKTRSPIKINRLQVVDSYQKIDKPPILSQRSSKGLSSQNEEIKEIKIISLNNQYKNRNNSQQDNLIINNTPQDLEPNIKRLQINSMKTQNLKKQFITSQYQLTRIKSNSIHRCNSQEIGINQSQDQSSQNLIKINTKDENNCSIENSTKHILNNNFQKNIQQNKINNNNKPIQIQQQNNEQNQQINIQNPINQNLIKQSYSLTNNNSKSSLFKNKVAFKQSNISSLSSILFTQLKERMLMNQFSNQNDILQSQKTQPNQKLFKKLFQD